MYIVLVLLMIYSIACLKDIAVANRAFMNGLFRDHSRRATTGKYLKPAGVTGYCYEYHSSAFVWRKQIT